MPRKTPVKELQKEEPVVSSPLRRSSRLNANSPVPTKVLTRRSSASEVPTTGATVTRSRRSSLSQETQPIGDVQSDKKKPASTIRTRRSSQLQDNEEVVQEEPVQKTRTRGSSVPKEQTPEVKMTTRRRKSITEISEVDAGSAKKVTRSRSSSLTKKDDDIKPSTKKPITSIKDVPVSTPVKKKSSPQNADGILESIEETNKEVDSSDEVVSTNKRKNTEISKVDFDLSVINEASLTDEEMSPLKKNQSTRETEDQSAVDKKGLESENNLQENVLKDKKAVLPNAESTILKESSEDGPKLDNSVPKDCKKNIEELETSISDSSFNLQLSSSVLESSNKNETDALDTSNKENVSPQISVQQSECEPMDVDDSVLEVVSPIKNVAMKSPKKQIGTEKVEIEQKLQVAEKVTDEMAYFLSEEIRFHSGLENNKEGKQIKSTAENGRSDALEKTNTVIETKQVQLEESFKNDIEDACTTGQKSEEKLVALKVRKSMDLVTEADMEESDKRLNGVEDLTNDIALVEDNNAQKHGSSKGIDEPLSTPCDDVSQVTPETESPVKTNDEEAISEQADGEFSLQSKIVKTGLTEVDISSKAIQEETVEPEESQMKEGTSEVVVSESKSNDIVCPQEKINTTEDLSEIDHNVSMTINNEENETTVSCQDSASSSFTESPKKAKNVQDVSKESDKSDDCDIIESESVTDVNGKTLLSEKGGDSKFTNMKDTNDSSPKRTEIIVNGGTSNDDYLDSEVIQIDEIIDRVIEKTKALQERESIIVCDSESDQEVNLDSGEDDDSYRSPVKKLRTYSSISDDEIFTRKDTNTQTNDIFERSLDSKYYITMRTRTPVKVKSQSCSKDEVIELSDKDEVEESSENSQANDKGSVENRDTNKDIEDADVETNENEGVTNASGERKEPAENSSFRDSFRKRSLEKASIVLQEVIQADDEPEKSLSGRIHNVVDLFCAGLKNKSDISVNVSFECTGQGSDSEDENNKTKVVEISFTASGIDGTEAKTLKGSKRRKVCDSNDHHTSSPTQSKHESQLTNEKVIQTPSEASVTTEGEDVTSATYNKRRSVVHSIADVHQSTPKLSESIDNEEAATSAKKSKKRKSIRNIVQSNSNESQSTHNSTFEASPKASWKLSIGDEDTVTSPKISQKRKSVEHDGDASHLMDKNATKTSLKNSVTFDIDEKIKSPGKSKTRRSKIVDTSEESVAEDQEKNPVKKLVPATPFKLSNVGGKSDEESSVTIESSDDESVVSENSTLYNKFLSLSFGESENDTTWNTQIETNSCSTDSELNDSDVDEEDNEVLLKEVSPVKGKRTKGRSYSSNDDVFVDAAVEKEKSPDKKKARKLIRLSTYDSSKAMGSPESEQSMPNKPKPTNKGVEDISDVTPNRSKTKGKKSKHTFFIKSEAVENMLPETSEMQGTSYETNNKKRKHVISHKEKGEQATRKTKAEEVGDFLSKKKMEKGPKNKRDSPVQIKPSAGNRKNVKPLPMKPSTKTTCDWHVTRFS